MKLRMPPCVSFSPPCVFGSADPKNNSRMPSLSATLQSWNAGCSHAQMSSSYRAAAAAAVDCGPGGAAEDAGLTGGTTVCCRCMRQREIVVVVMLHTVEDFAHEVSNFARYYYSSITRTLASSSGKDVQKMRISLCVCLHHPTSHVPCLAVAAHDCPRRVDNIHVVVIITSRDCVERAS